MTSIRQAVGGPTRSALASFSMVMATAMMGPIGPGAARADWIQAARTVAQERGPSGLCWRLEYRLRNLGPDESAIAADALAVAVTGAVSNSAVPGHELPRPADHRVEGGFARSAAREILASTDEAGRCRERLAVRVWLPGRQAAPTLADRDEAAPDKGEGRVKDDKQAPPAAAAAAVLRVPPGGELGVSIWLEHDHPLHGPSFALLGSRAIEIRIGPDTVRDRVALDRPRRLPAPEHVLASWPPPTPAELSDPRVYLSAPESLHLEVNVPGKQSHRFPDFRAARPGGRVRLGFWYLRAPDTDAQPQVRITQYRDLPRSWRTLHDGEVIEELAVAGRWVHVQRIVRVEPEATSLAVEVRLIGGMTGDLWLDDIRLDPIEINVAGP
jgi:hypothetical protein